MCGIVGAVAQRNITPILLEGLKRLEYRGRFLRYCAAH
jgi:glucosamine--fructose-6-phosphate aminotransferase (isomerizing)